MAHGTKFPEEFAAPMFGVGECILPSIWMHHITSNAPFYLLCILHHLLTFKNSASYI